MVNLLEAAKAATKSKLRLWIEYLLIAIILVLMGVAAYNWVTRLKQDTRIAVLESDVRAAEDRVKLVEEVNEQQAAAIDTIRGLNDVNDTMLKGLATDMEALRVRDRTAFSRLAALEKSNEAVRQYLNTVVPAPVGCVLDRSCPNEDADPVPSAKRGPATRVPAAGAGAKQD